MHLPCQGKWLGTRLGCCPFVIQGYFTMELSYCIITILDALICGVPLFLEGFHLIINHGKKLTVIINDTQDGSISSRGKSDH